MNPHLLQRSSLLTGITSLLAILLAVTWTVSFFYFIQLHQLKVDSNISHHQLGSQISISLAKKQDAAAANQGQGNKSGNGNNNPSNSNDVHIVFSTDCSGYQHWQAIASYYSFRRAGHLGPITRIVSGCKPSQEEEIRTEFHKIQQNSNNHQLRLHFTPSFALGGKHYKYSNKPGGLYHWIMNHTTLEESVIALVDPDMISLRPMVPQLGEGMTPTSVTRDGYRDLVEYRDEHGKVLLLRQKHLPTLPSRVTKGVAAGQHFGIGGLWASSGTKNARKDFREFNLTMVCGSGSPCLNNVPLPPTTDGSASSNKKAYTTRELADENYAVGPVYIASTSDWMDLLPRWHTFTPRVHAQYPKLLAEMYAFTMAAADMQLTFALSSSYMVSDPGTMSTTEGWMWIDEYAEREPISIITREIEQRPVGNTLRSVCDGATSNSLPTKTLRRLEKYGYGNYHGSDAFPSADERGGGALPTVLHYCQNYKLANHTFAKRKMPHDFFRCNGEPLEFDVEALVKELDSIENDGGFSETQKKKQMRTGFMLCHLVPLMNMALIDYKLD
eukprot:CAMPEP_0201896600 /NCGR_PEP_ID=MMETSP0902-20130614/44950_1 /ASSEMBLY_ACC=CAM_ASM_000551 /TAXON_ID=420261 /ORGANISM="Thalassiosira antarctica, Strain CCMP982" /LENGTH=555 /DNA_ID=CAMNT_0048429239 /DNA_START=95 /DNA_END=1759 /DNA_ORIENTATION=-